MLAYSYRRDYPGTAAASRDYGSRLRESDETGRSNGVGGRSRGGQFQVCVRERVCVGRVRDSAAHRPSTTHRPHGWPHLNW